MDHIQPIDAGNADGLHGLFLDLAHHRSRFLAGMGPVMHHIQDGAHFLLPDHIVQFGRIDGFAGLVLQDGDIQLDHLPGLFFQRHLGKYAFHFRFHILVGGNARFRTGASTGRQNCSTHDNTKKLIHIITYQY